MDGLDRIARDMNRLFDEREVYIVAIHKIDMVLSLGCESYDSVKDLYDAIDNVLERLNERLAGKITTHEQLTA